LPVEDFLFSAGGGFLFGAVAGYAIKKVMKIAAVIVGLLVVTCSLLANISWSKHYGGCCERVCLKSLIVCQ
jgi:uncharacterized membrane protein (Fun14 family)